MTPPCESIPRTSKGLLELARRLPRVLKVEPEDRRNEPGVCELCGSELPYAWRAVHHRTLKAREFLKGSPEALRCSRNDFNGDMWSVTPNYLCGVLVDRWGCLEGKDLEELASEWMAPDGPRRKEWVRKGELVSALDIAMRLEGKLEFDGGRVLLETSPGKKKGSLAPVDMI